MSVSARVKYTSGKPTNINTWSSFCSDHHILEFIEVEAFARHSVHSMIQHLARGIGIFDLISCQSQEQ